MRRDTVPTLVAVALSLAALGCSTPKRAIVEYLKSAAKGNPSGYDGTFRSAMCGWDPRVELELDTDSVETTLNGSNDKGSAETAAKFVAPAGSKTSSLRCEGRVAYDYEYHPGQAGKHGSYFEMKSVHRVGDPPAILDDIEEHATKLELDTETKAFDDDWTLPDGTAGAAYRVEIEKAGSYALEYDTKFEAHKSPRIAVFQKKTVILEGDRFGRLGFWPLKAGTAWFLLAANQEGKPRVQVTTFD